MKIIYYVTDHGLGHSSRTVAIVRELEKLNAHIIIRNNDIHYFLKKSLPNTKIILGQTDFTPIMNKRNNMKMDYPKTQKSIAHWLQRLPNIVEKESIFIRKEKPDVIITDISIMPLLISKNNGIKFIAISNFSWNEVLDLNKKTERFFTNAYKNSDLIVRLPFGSTMNFSNKMNMGLVARRITKTKSEVRKQLGLYNNQKLVLLSLSNISNKISFEKSDDVMILDISDYTNIMKLGKKINFLEGQNLVNASDLVICKCGYGFISECLTLGVKFRYLLEPTHKEANAIHKNLVSKGLRNRIFLDDIKKLKIDVDFISNSESLKIKNDVSKVAQEISRLCKPS